MQHAAAAAAVAVGAAQSQGSTQGGLLRPDQDHLGGLNGFQTSF